jgi:serine/threonine protein kinase/TPR repeat protein
MADTETFQHYQVLKRPDGSLWELGRGAMGVTYKAFDTNLRCNVALKVINSAYLESEMAQQRFLREARAAAGLSHPNVASVFHLGESGGNYFYAMEYIDGETLEAFVRRQGALAPVVALQIALQVTRALRAASREGLVHRDIKPANLMLLRQDDEDEILVKVIDFGLAKVSRADGEASALITMAGFVGTPHFASPEQLEEKDLDVRSDIYSLGVCLWYMLTGKPPFAGSVVQIMSQQLSRRPPFEQLTGTPPAVVHLLEHLLEKEAAKRPQTAADLRREIEQVIRTLQFSGGAPAAAGPLPGSPPAREPASTAFPTEAITEEHPAGGDSGQLSAPEPASGVVLAAKYRLLHSALPGQGGDLFQAIELDSGRAVAVKILPAEAMAAPEQFRRLEEEVNHARAAPHPNLLETYALERSGARAFLAFEWVNGFTALDLLRNRHALAVPEALTLLEPLAAAADHARAHGLSAPDLSPAHVLLAFDAAVDLPARTALLPAPLRGWPAFRPKVLPLHLGAELASSATWAGQQTIVPAAPVAAGGVVRQLALLAYELLGGGPAPVTNAAGKSVRAPLPALSEQGNAVLRAGGQGGDSSAYATASDFVAALRASVTGSPAPTPVRSAAAAVAPSAPPAPLRSTVSRSEPALAAPSALPPVLPPPQQRPPQRPSPAAPPPPRQETKGSARRTLMTVIILFIVCSFLGLVAGLGFAAWKFVLPKYPSILSWIGVASDVTPSPSASPAARRALALGTPASHLGAGAPTPANASVYPFPTAAFESPTPRPTAAGETPGPGADRAARFQELLAKAQSLDQAGDAAGALDSYVTLAQDYPERDLSLSRVDSFISTIRANPLTPDAEDRRTLKLREPMERAAGLGSDQAMLYLGDHLLKTEPETAAKWFAEAADKGEPEAMFALGNMYFNGTGVPKQPAEASHWFTLASDKGFVRAKIYLAECYEVGKGGVKQDPSKAFSLLNEALGIDPNNAIAMEKLALEYERGSGTPVDSNKAFELMQRAVELGDVNATGNLGLYYMNGLGGHKDPKMAVKLFKQGADKNNAFCMFLYADALWNGLGTPANHAVAKDYYRASASRGFPPARQWLNENHVPLDGSN